MTENRRRVLDMLAEGKIGVEEAERLLASMERSGAKLRPSHAEDSRGPAPKYLRVTVEPNPDAGPDAGQQRVNVRVPMALIRAGVKLTALIPSVAAAGLNQALREQGIDLDLRNLKVEDLEQLVDTMRDLEVDIQDGEQSVRVYVE